MAVKFAISWGASCAAPVADLIAKLPPCPVLVSRAIRCYDETTGQRAL